MTPAELKTLLDNIVANLNSVAEVAAGIDPALKPFVAIGKAIDLQIPGLVASVDNWIQGNPPTDAEVAELQHKLSVLGNPDLP